MPARIPEERERTGAGVFEGDDGDEQDCQYRSRIPLAESTHSIAGHVSPPPQAIHDDLLEQNPGVEERQSESDSDDEMRVLPHWRSPFARLTAIVDTDPSQARFRTFQTSS